jgi:hypothetical protein
MSSDEDMLRETYRNYGFAHLRRHKPIGKWTDRAIAIFLFIIAI